MADEIDPLAARLGLIVDSLETRQAVFPRSGVEKFTGTSRLLAEELAAQGLRPTTTS